MACAGWWRADWGFAWFWSYRHSYDVVALFEVDAVDTVGGPAHGANVIFIEANGHAFMRSDENDLVAVGDAGGDKFVSLFDTDGINAVGTDVHKFAQLRFLDQAVAGGKENVFILFLEIAHGQHGADRFARLQADQVTDVLASSGVADVWDFVDLQPVHAAFVGEDKDVSVG